MGGGDAFYLQEAARKTLLVLGDPRKWCQRRRCFPGAFSAEKAGLRSARSVISGRDATSKGLDRFRCGKPGHQQLECRKQVFTVAPGSEAGRQGQSAGRSNGRGAARSRRRTVDVPSSVAEDPEAGRPRHEELARIVVAIERLSDAIERNGSILREGWGESAVVEKETKPSLTKPPGGEEAAYVRFWQTNLTTTLSWMFFFLYVLRCSPFVTGGFAESGGGA